MPSYQTAKTVAENALSTIGAFPASMSQADEGELRKTMTWLEMVLNTTSGIMPLAGFYRVVDIPVEAGIGDYFLTDYADLAEVQHVFSASIVNDSGSVVPLIIEYESQGALENLKREGTPHRAVITKDVKPVLSVYPTPTITDQNQGSVIRIRFQTYHPGIAKDGIGDNDLLIRPSWYLWLTKRVAYEIGSGPVRRLADGELRRLKEDADYLLNRLEARDGRYNAGSPPIMEPMFGSDLT